MHVLMRILILALLYFSNFLAIITKTDKIKRL